jgi:hypothetical protein
MMLLAFSINLFPPFLFVSAGSDVSSDQSFAVVVASAAVAEADVML